MIKKVMEIKPCKNNIGAEIGIDLQKISNENIQSIKKALNEYGVIFFRKQNLSPSEYIKFAKNFGELADYPMLKGLSEEFSKITVVERKPSDKGPSFGEQFHTDSSYTDNPPRFTMLMAKIVPPRGQGNTDFASQYLAYENLPENYKKKLENLKGIFSSSGPISVTRVDREKEKGTGKSKDFKAKHKIVLEIERKKTIYCSPGHMIKFDGVSYEESEKIKKFLFKHQIRKDFLFSFEWERNTIAIWDNRSMLHQATSFKGTRVMHRITIQ